jgi:hypothetical protein
LLTLFVGLVECRHGDEARDWKTVFWRLYTWFELSSTLVATALNDRHLTNRDFRLPCAPRHLARPS